MSSMESSVCWDDSAPVGKKLYYDFSKVDVPADQIGRIIATGCPPEAVKLNLYVMVACFAQKRDTGQMPGFLSLLTHELQKYSEISVCIGVHKIIIGDAGIELSDFLPSTAKIIHVVSEIDKKIKDLYESMKKWEAGEMLKYDPLKIEDKKKPWQKKTNPMIVDESHIKPIVADLGNTLNINKKDEVSPREEFYNYYSQETVEIVNSREKIKIPNR